MKIREFQVVGLFGRDDKVVARLNGDLNILTGRNGSGKTSILKLLWYIMSGNILNALKEVNFRKATLVTDEYECTVHRIDAFHCKIELTIDGRTRIFEDIVDGDGDVVINAEDEVDAVLRVKGGSVFLPTFRRIEGGFTIGTTLSQVARLGRPKNEVEESMSAVAKKLTHENHVFVSSTSTVDIVTLLLKKYADLSQSYTDVQQETSNNIISDIKAFKSDALDVTQIKAANEVLDKIRAMIEDMESRREQIMNPFHAISPIVKRLFRHTGIKIGGRLSFGEAANAINSESLSAGEKQMLSFICYNAFYRDSVIFIDEPELSLHVDWQRQLFPVLQRQQSSNQFIIATHSPFIFSKFPDKEIPIDADRGDENYVEEE
ncbi:AAA family ATPase [Burkholderia ambifaria]|uniref:AAA family ATPase n=1 Tax=Burkholderia ambifaria TaxID=152480 RepID=UPI00158C324A|nr:AAA family ATPase [Burkholderia ambifaria]